MTPALILVVVFGIGATVAIPRMWSARAGSLDAVAIGEAHRAIEQIEAYRRQNGALPASPEAAAVAPSDHTMITMWARQTMAGIESVHIHVKHRRSDRTFHAHYPYEDGVIELPSGSASH